MSPLQWALLILGVVIVAALIASAWREKRDSEKPSPAKKEGKEQRPRFGHDWDPADRRGPEGFDEFGVSRARSVGGSEGEDDAIREPQVPAGDINEDDIETQQNPAFPEPVSKQEPEEQEMTAPPQKPADGPSMLIAFYIAEHEGTAILGPKIHESLKAHGLKFGAKKVYHRLSNGEPVFGVASLTKPGTLDPAEADGFSTPGLSVFLQLPGPVPSVEAFSDMVTTAKALARDLKAEVFDTELQSVLTPERERELRQQVREFAHQSGM